MTERTAQQLNHEYTELAARLGHTLIQIDALSSEIPKIKESVQKITLEMNELQAKTKAAEGVRSVTPSEVLPA